MKKTDSNEKRGGIYIHIPFCVRKCAYCDFLSAPADEKTQAEYVKALQTEIYQTAKLLSENPYTVDTVFFGGGTPSILAPGHVKALADTLRESFPFAENAEITIECNPGTLDEDTERQMYDTACLRLADNGYHQFEISNFAKEG